MASPSPFVASLADESEGDATPTAAPRDRAAVDALLALDSDDELAEAQPLPQAGGRALRDVRSREHYCS